MPTARLRWCSRTHDVVVRATNLFAWTCGQYRPHKVYRRPFSTPSDRDMGSYLIQYPYLYFVVEARPCPGLQFAAVEASRRAPDVIEAVGVAKVRTGDARALSCLRRRLVRGKTDAAA